MLRVLITLASVAASAAQSSPTPQPTRNVDTNNVAVPFVCIDGDSGADVPCGGNTLVNNAVRNTCPACNDGIACSTPILGQSLFSKTTKKTTPAGTSPSGGATPETTSYDPTPLLLNGVALADPALGFVADDGVCGTDTDAKNKVLVLKVTNPDLDSFAVWIGDSNFGDTKQACDYNANYGQVATIDPATNNLVTLGTTQAYPYGVGPNDEGAPYSSSPISTVGSFFKGSGQEFNDPELTLRYSCTAASCCAWMSCMTPGGGAANPPCPNCCTFTFSLTFENPSPTPTPTPSISESPSGSPSVSSSPSMTPTASPSITDTQTPSVTPTPTQTKSAGASSSRTPTFTPTTSGTPSQSPTTSKTRTISGTATGTPSRSITPTSTTPGQLSAKRVSVQSGSASYVKLPVTGKGATVNIFVNVTDPYTDTYTQWGCDDACFNYVPGFNVTLASKPEGKTVSKLDEVPYTDTKTNKRITTRTVSNSCQSPSKWICAAIQCISSSPSNTCSTRTQLP